MGYYSIDVVDIFRYCRISIGIGTSCSPIGSVRIAISSSSSSSVVRHSFWWNSCICSSSSTRRWRWWHNDCRVLFELDVKRQWIATQDPMHGQFSLLFVLWSIEAQEAATVETTVQFKAKALTVQLETSRLFARASHMLNFVAMVRFNFGRRGRSAPAVSRGCGGYHIQEFRRSWRQLQLMPQIIRPSSRSRRIIGSGQRGSSCSIVSGRT